MRHIQAVLFDLDGVLVDAVGWHAEAFLKAAAGAGINIDRSFHDRELNGLPTTQKLQMLGVPPELAFMISVEKQRLTDEIIQARLKPDPKKLQLLIRLKELRYLLGCCSNALPTSVHTMLSLAGLLPFFDIVLGSTQVEHPKPHPAIYLEAMERLGVSPERTLILEDSPPGVAAARASLARVFVVDSYDEVGIPVLSEVLDDLA